MSLPIGVPFLFGHSAIWACSSGQFELFKELDFKELDSKELGVLGYLDLLGLGVLGYSDLLGLGVPKETIRGDYSKETIRRRLFEGVAHTIFFGVVPEFGT